MLSRRNVRIKIMQVLYAAQRQENSDAKYARSLFDGMVRRSFQLYLQNLLILQRVCEYAKVDAATRKTKLRPSEEDRVFSPILTTNSAIENLSANNDLSRKYEEYGVKSMIDADQVKRLYREFVATEQHQAFLIAEPDVAAVRIELLRLYKWLQGQELFINMIEDHFPLWAEDKSLVIGAIKKTVKALPAEDQHFYRAYESPSEAVAEFGHELLRFVITADRQLLKEIEPLLQNWDADRVAIIDMILLKMAMGEFLQFEGIPPQVTLNEYVDISKLYSTPKSKEFINGVLDKLLSELRGKGMIAE